jgi:hypothetical protein
VRSIDDHPTAHSWLHIFRILSLYNPTKVAIRNANVDGKDAGEILVAYKQCLVYKFRECEKEAKEIKKNLKDSLQKELLARYTNDIPDGKSDITRDELVYDLCGYLIHTRHEVCGTCKDCNNLMETEETLMEDFLPAQYTYQRNYGSLKYATAAMFRTFREVENVIDSHFSSPNHIFVRDSYEEVLSKIRELSLIPISCSQHPGTLSYLIMEYVQIRFHFEAKRFQNLHLSNQNASILNHKKLSKTST